MPRLCAPVRRGALAVLLLAACASRAAAINVVIDYTYASNTFFPVGGQARAAIQAAASFYSGMLTDTLAAVATPPDYIGANGSRAYWGSTIGFDHPTNAGGEVSVANIMLAADEYRIYVGSMDLTGNNIGVGGPGGEAGWSVNSTGPGFTSSEISQINQITNNFVDALRKRGETSGFASWGGVITFDSAETSWHFNHNTPPAAGTNDFYSVALHEMAHALGFGSSNQWDNFAGGSLFAGPAAIAKYGSPPPLGSPNEQGKRDHWASDTMSKIFGTNTPQETAMDPDITVATRKRFTSLDAAALIDIGWSLSEPTPPTYNVADFNQDGVVNAPDLAIWRTAYRTTTAGNADGDGDTDGNDFLIWQRNVGRTSLAAAGGGVPEPSGVAMIVWLVALRARRGQRLRGRET